MSTIRQTIIDRNLFSGSNEITRNHLGFYYVIESGSNGESAQWAPDYPQEPVRNTDFAGIIENQKLYDYSGIIKQISMNFDLETTASSQVIFPNRKIPVRFHGNPDNITSDEQWNAAIYGGTWSTGSYLGAYLAGTHDSNKFLFETSYPLLEAREMAGEEYTTFITYDIGYEYNAYYPIYQNHISDVGGEVYIPNTYYIQYAYDDDGMGENRFIADYITRDSAVDEDEQLIVNTGSLLTPADSTVPPPYVVTDEDIVYDTMGDFSGYTDKTLHLRNYLTGALIENPVVGPAMDFVTNETVNLLFSEEAIEALFANVESNKSLFPFYAKIEINLPEGAGYNSDKSNFKKYIQDSDYEHLLLYELKKRFVTQDSVSTYSATKSSYYQSSSYSEATEENVLIELEDVRDVTYRMVDFPGILMESLNRPAEEKTTDCYFVGPQNLETRTVDNPEGTFRYSHAIGSLKMIEHLKTFMETDQHQRPVQTDFFNSEDEKTGGVLGFLQYPGLNDAYTETIAYRIKKTNTVTKEKQNIFLSNCETLGDSFTYYDTQVKYDTEYSYEIFSYKIFAGYKYNFSNSVISRNIGSGSGDFESWNCLQFEDRSGQPSSQLLFEFEDNPLADSNQYATNAQTVSQDSYLFDFYLNIESMVKIIECPIANDTVTVLDHPPVQIDVTPYQRMDNSQVIGFFANFESFSKNTFPAPLTADDMGIAAAYLNSNNILSTTDIELPSVSRIKYVDVYRLTNRPATMQDFSTGYVTTKNLSIKDTDFTDTTCFYEEKIQTNTKYYYLFRFRNEQGMFGRCSRIVVAEMIDDGGYKYSQFETLESSDLVESNFEEVRLQFKKLINIVPNINQIILDDKDVDYTGTARAQIGNLNVGVLNDAIWDKTFKLRLTSKKTGKKIDINLTYNIKEEL